MIDLINKIIDKRLVLINKVGKVIAVDKTNASCDIEPLNGDAEKFDVRLTAKLGNTDGFVVYPKTGSFVIFTSVDNNPDLSFVSLFSEIDEIVINKGVNNGMVKVKELTERLNEIEKAFNKLLNEFKTHNHLHPMAPTTGLLVPVTLSDIDETEQEYIENTKIRH